ncbi:FAD-linked oxidase C-terminal domain-containing protein [Immundisolibacter sp.]|uniref:FAD-linked oxidase C-terminal domain-containing protein n=1 Tax=Immundisolibacter sp. TaxID=1934948 RepID=UPI00356A05AE
MTLTHTQAADSAGLLEALRDVLPPDGLITAEAERRVYECDALANYCALPLAVALPETIAQVQAVLRVCREHGAPVVPRGAGTGLSAGALPREDGVLLSMTRLDRILGIDPDNRVARVQPGVRNLAVSEAAAEHGLFYAPDPSSQFASSIGGNIAENSGGVHCVKYGLTTHNLLEVTLVTMDGELLTLGGALDSPGYDLLALVTGSEGMLGVVVEARLKLLPLPESIVLLQAAFPDLERAGRAVMDIIAGGVVPAGLEMMDQVAIEVVEGYIQMGLPVDAAALLLCELDGADAEVEAQLERVQALMQACDGYAIRVARDADERTRLWAGRKGAFPAMGRVSPDFYITDATVPRRHLAGILRRIGELAREYELRVATAFHAGDGNLHPLILYDGSVPDEVARTEALASRILDECLALGGTISGEHGIGAEKIDKACRQFGDAEIGDYFAVKRAFDPSGLLNPGKAIPTLVRCAELRGSHVHHGQVPHPELERF